MPMIRECNSIFDELKTSIATHLEEIRSTAQAMGIEAKEARVQAANQRAAATQQSLRGRARAARSIAEKVSENALPFRDRVSRFRERTTVDIPEVQMALEAADEAWDACQSVDP